eukprot:5219845-Prymnesium_polylepis.1
MARVRNARGDVGYIWVWIIDSHSRPADANAEDLMGADVPTGVPTRIGFLKERMRVHAEMGEMGASPFLMHKRPRLKDELNAK